THELKTPLNSIINFSEYVKKSLINSKAEIENREKLVQLLTVVHKNSMLLLENVNDILDIAKLKSGKMNFLISTFSINKMINSEITNIHQHFDGILIDIVENGEVLISTDEFRFKQIFTNILSNAIKYGNKKIEINIFNDGSSVGFSIEDNGHGIKEKERVFELFEQEDSKNIDRVTKGTGVGLHFIKLLCENLNLNYKLEDSIKLGGAKFTIYKGIK
ncbi:MAG: HAMP domain-containing histidine kinase, partial [Campylobacterales bacterium]|nr:HAMP domain-containing histidine kinase [Campylobacterales bacterium]